MDEKEFEGKVVTWSPDRGFGFLEGVEGNAFVALSVVGQPDFQRLGEAKGIDQKIRYRAVLRSNKHGVDQWQVTKLMFPEDEHGETARVVDLLTKILNILERLESRIDQTS